MILSIEYVLVSWVVSTTHSTVVVIVMAVVIALIDHTNQLFTCLNISLIRKNF